MLEKTAQQSLLDMLVQIMPALQIVKDKAVGKNDVVTNSLYTIWDGAGKTASRKFLRPANIGRNDLSKMIAAGLIEEQGKYIKITDKGAQSLKVMILNDNTFALAKTASNGKTLGWFDKIKYEDYLS